MTGFSERLRLETSDNWQAAINHRFVDEIFRGAVPQDVMRRYLIQDYQFVDRFVALLGMAIATADLFDSRIRFAQFAAMITSDENTYFQRAFDALDAPMAARENPVLTAPTVGFRELMRQACDSRNYAACLAVLAVAEGIYLEWADRPNADLPEDFVHAEWITLHNNAGFRAFVDWLRSELDRAALAASAANQVEAAAFFHRAVALEREFFDHVYDK